jgi:hypothetical protein
VVFCRGFLHGVDQASRRHVLAVWEACRILFVPEILVAISSIWSSTPRHRLFILERKIPPCSNTGMARRVRSSIITSREATTRALHLRITCPTPPSCPFDSRPTEFGVQDREQVVHQGQVHTDGSISFEVTVSAVRHAAGSLVRFRGPFVHGTPAEPFLYLGFRHVEGSPVAWIRRIKVRFPVLTWEQLEAIPETSVLAARVSGERRRTIPLHTYDWTQQDAVEP